MSIADILDQKQRPVALIILDGWGIAPETEGNAIFHAKTPFFDELVDRYPAMLLKASGAAVGLPEGVMGNSEVGHLTIGSGRVNFQGLELINQSISDGSFFKKDALLNAIKHVKKYDSQLHLMGLVSDGLVHASFDHLVALLELAKRKKINKVFVHVFLDGRDTPKASGAAAVAKLEKTMQDMGVGEIATISGRFYAMDRDHHWDRIQKAYTAIVKGVGERSGEIAKAIAKSYEQEIFDEEFLPTVIVDHDNKPKGVIGDKDAVIFFNFRADRARELSKALIEDKFDNFKRAKLKDLMLVTMTEYETGLKAVPVFTKEIVSEGLGEVVAAAGLKQLRAAETEKYAHVTYFFNGGREEPLAGEDRLLIASPRVDSYASTPEMSARELTDGVIAKLNKEKYGLVVVNYANPDMVGHTGNLEATKIAIETVDECLKKLIKKILDLGGLALIIADHGNAEIMINQQLDDIHKEHTVSPVPLIVVGGSLEGYNLGTGDAGQYDLASATVTGELSDIAPTIIKLLGLQKPEKMIGKALI